MQTIEGSFDFIVVGGGTAGCLLAARLSADSRRRVCLIEAGGDGRSRAVDVPSGLVMAQRSPELNWRYQSAPQPRLAGRRIGYPRGKGLGGSALINGMVYFRGHPLDFDDWARAGATGWGYRDVLPYFRRSERNENHPDSPFHGRSGPMNVRTVTHPNRLNFAFFDALESLGIAPNPDLNAGDSEGSALRQLQIRDGIRDTTARAMLRPALGRANLVVLTGAHATRVLLEGQRATGVEALAPEGFLTVRCRGEVVLSAGALQSPQLLLLSGIGDGSELAQAGITPRHQLPGVGRNLHDHLASPVHRSTKISDSYGMSWKALPRNAWQAAQYLFRRIGPLANNIFEAAAFVRTKEGLDRPDVQLVFQPAKRPSPKFPFPVGHGYAISPVGLYPRSRGRITLSGPDPLAPPVIDPALLSAPEDIEPLIRGIRLARRVFDALPFAHYRAAETAPGLERDSDESLSEYIRNEAYTVHHPVSTCRMGQDADAVVDPELRVRGLDGLRVADASVFPSIVGGNTNAAVMMVAEKAADLLLDRTPLAPAEIPELQRTRP
ncbi:MAG: alcohol dehydrogenase [Pseudomonadota bacterium]|jgi:choline dehydrogenase-like flavoprotein